MIMDAIEGGLIVLGGGTISIFYIWGLSWVAEKLRVSRWGG